MDKRTLSAIVICLAIAFGWQKFYLEPQTKKQNAVQTQIAQKETQIERAAAKKEPTDTLGVPSEKTTKNNSLPIATESVAFAESTATVSNEFQFLKNWSLKNYRRTLAKDAMQVDLKDLSLVEQNTFEMNFDSAEFSYLSSQKGEMTKEGNRFIWSFEDDKIKIKRVIEPNEKQNDFTVSLSVESKTKDAPKNLFLLLNSSSNKDLPEAQDRTLSYYANTKMEKLLLTDDIKTQETAGEVKWVAALSRYFVMAALPVAGPAPKVLQQQLAKNTARIGLVYPISNGKIDLSYRLFFGPKELTLLRAVDPSLDLTVDLGWFTIVAYPILQLMVLIHKFVQNYGIAIILLTLFIKLLTYPLTYKSMKSMKDMAKIQPQIKKLQEKHKDDREKLNKEMMALMKTGGYNPAAGCLPMLIQMPIFIALYRVLYSSVELYQSPFFGWIHDLSMKDPYYITPVVLTVVMFLQQKLTPQAATADPAQQKMMQFMPLIFGAFMISLPAGLTIYMLTNALASIAQQLFLNKKLGITPQPAKA